MTQPYENKTPTSCVFDAFEAAGLPTDKRMKYGIRTDELVRLLEQNGYKLFYKGSHLSIPEGCGFFVIRDWKKNFSHIEYHIDCRGITDYQPESIGAIAVRVS